MNASPSENIRNIWANKFNDEQPSNQATATVTSASNETTNRLTSKNKVTESSSAWEEIDDDILIHSVQNAVIEIDDGSNDGFLPAVAIEPTARSSKPPVSIKRELLDDLGEEDENIEMIDDEFDDTLNESLDILTDTSVIDELFGKKQTSNSKYLRKITLGTNYVFESNPFSPFTCFDIHFYHLKQVQIHY